MNHNGAHKYSLIFCIIRIYLQAKFCTCYLQLIDNRTTNYMKRQKACVQSGSKYFGTHYSTYTAMPAF
jgi:hypothetical protein